MPECFQNQRPGGRRHLDGISPSVVTHLYFPESAVPNNGIALGISSRFLIESLNKHGFCSPCKEVIRFGKCSAVNQGFDIPNYGSQFV